MLTVGTRRALLRKREKIAKLATVDLDGRAIYSDLGFRPDRSGNGHHGWYGGVKRAVIADTVYRDRGLILPGIAGNYASVPDSAGVSITGSISVRWRARMTDWTPATGQVALGKWVATGNQKSWVPQLLPTTGKLKWNWTENGSTDKQATSTVAPSVVDGVFLWCRVDFNAANGNTTFYTGGSGVTPVWVQLGDVVAGAGATSIFDSTAAIDLGAYNGGGTENMLGTLSHVVIYADLTETDKRLDVDFTTQAQGTRSFVCTTGQTVTVNQAGSSAAEPTRVHRAPTDDYFLWFPGTSGNYASVPDAAALDITGDIDVRWYGAADDWTPSLVGTVFAKWTGTGNQRSWRLALNTNGTLSLKWTEDGSTVKEAVSTAAPIVTGGAGLWVRVTLDVDDGSGNYDATFYTSSDGSTWTQLGNVITAVGTTSIYSSTAVVEISSINAGTAENTIAKNYRAQIYSGIDGTKVLDIDFTALASYSAARTSLTALTGQTVTLNRAASGKKLTFVEEDGETCVLGTNSYIEIDDHARLDFGDDQPLTVAAAIRGHHQVAAFRHIVAAKRATSTGVNVAGYTLHRQATGAPVRMSVGDSGSASVYASALSDVVLGYLTVVSGLTSGTSMQAFVDGVEGVAAADSVGDKSNASPLTIGALSSPGGENADMEFLRFLLFRRALTDAQLLQLNREYGAAA